MGILRENIIQAVGYGRVSTQRQALHGNSMSLQDRDIIEYCDDKSYNLLKIFRDPGKSGRHLYDGNGNILRPIFFEFLEFVESALKKGDKIVFWAIDRSARDIIAHGKILEICARKGLSVECVTENYTDDPMGQLLMNINAAIAQYRVDTDLKKSKDNMIDLAREGYSLYMPPIGFIKDPNQNAEKVRRVIPDPDRYDLVKKAWHLLLSELYTVKEILERINGMGLRNRKGNLISITTLSDVLHNPFYAGKQVYSDWGIDVVGEHSEYAMVTIEEFELAQSILSGRNRNKTRKANFAHPDFVLAKILRCPYCNHVMSGYKNSNGRGNKYEWYECKNRDCKLPTKPVKYRLKKSESENLFIGYIDGVKPSYDYFEYIKKKIYERYKESTYQNKDLTEQLEKDQKEVQSRIRNLEAALVSGRITESRFDEMKVDLKVRLAEVKRNITKTSEKIDNIPKLIDKVVYCIEHPVEVLKTPDTRLRVKILRELFPQGIHIQNENVSNIELNPFYKHFEPISCSKVRLGAPDRSYFEHLSELPSKVVEWMIALCSSLSRVMI